MTAQTIATVIIGNWAIGAVLIGLVACGVVCVIAWIARPGSWGFCGRSEAGQPPSEGLGD